MEVRRCPGWRRLAHDEELPCGNSRSTTRFCLRAQLRQIDSVSPPTLSNVGKAQNRRVLDGTFAHGHGTSAHTRSVAGSSPSLPRQTVPKRAPKRRRQATFRHQFCARLSGGRSSSGRTSGPCGRSGRAKILGASRPRKGPSGRTPESESRKPAAVPRRPCLEPRPLHSLSRACWLRGRLLQALRHDGRQCPEADFNIQVNSGYHGPGEYPVSEASSTPAATWALGGVVRGFLDNRRRHAGREQGPEIGDS